MGEGGFCKAFCRKYERWFHEGAKPRNRIAGWRGAGRHMIAKVQKHWQNNTASDLYALMSRPDTDKTRPSTVTENVPEKRRE